MPLNHPASTPHPPASGADCIRCTCCFIGPALLRNSGHKLTLASRSASKGNSCSRQLPSSMVDRRRSTGAASATARAYSPCSVPTTIVLPGTMLWLYLQVCESV